MTGARSSSGDGRLTRAPGEAATDRFLHDPADPVPTRGGRILGPWLPVAGPSDQRLVEERGDVLVFTSEPLTEDVTIMGAVEGSVVFETTGRSADVTMKLVDVHPDGRAFNVLDSVVRSAFTPGRPEAGHGRARLDRADVSAGSPHPARHRVVELPALRRERVDRATARRGRAPRTRAADAAPRRPHRTRG